MKASRALSFVALVIAGCDPAYDNLQPPKTDAMTSEPGDDAAVQTDGAPTDACTSVTYYADCDGDGVAGLGAQTQSACALPAPSSCGGTWVTTQPIAGTADCNDTRNDVRPGATEVCDGVDNDCDGPADEDGLTTFYRDMDGDNHGNPSVTMTTCMVPTGYVVLGDDCNDASNVVYPGRAEACDGLDNNCAGGVDEGVQTTYYRDVDVDGHGNAAVTTTACTAPSGFVASSDDCNDNSNLMYPGRAEACDLLDNNCNAQTDEGVQNTYYRDLDGDGFGNINVTMLACSASAGWTSNTTDCNDNSGSVNPNAAELCFNGADDNCSGQQDEAASCSADCNWSGARWLSAGYDGSGGDDVGVWATCQNFKLSYMQAVGAQIVRPATGTSTDYLDCDWGAASRRITQGYDGGNAYTFGASVACNGTRVTSLSWGNDQLYPGQIPQATNNPQLGCNWSGAIYLAKGVDGNCAPHNGIDVTCQNGHITGMHAWWGGTCGP